MNLARNKSRHYFIIGLALLIVMSFTLFFFNSLKLNSNTMLSPLVGKEAKEFHVPLLQGSLPLLGRQADSVELSELKGKPLIINFWSSWCSSCAAEAKAVEAFWKAHSLEVKVLGIAVHDSIEDVQTAIRSHGKTYAIGFDGEGRAALNYGVTGVPETVFINAQGVVVHKELGPVSAALLEQYLLKMKADPI